MNGVITKLEGLLGKQAAFQEKYFPVINLKESYVLVAINQELAELIDSLPFYKWWTKKPWDLDNAKIEAVDIFHFVLIYLLIERDIYKHYIYDKLVAIEKGFEYLTSKLTIEEILQNLVDMVNTTYLDLNFYEYLGALIGKLFETFDEFEELYLKKLALNEERQRKGYKENYSAKFLQNGQEDNVLLT